MQAETYARQLRGYERRRAEIRALYKQGRSLSEIARRYAISRQRVHQIVHNGKPR